MVDWVSVSFNAIWIVGLAILLASFSYHHWHASRVPQLARESRGLRQLAISAGMLLTCVGLDGLGDFWWERTIWTALAICCGAWFVGVARGLARGARDSRLLKP